MKHGSLVCSFRKHIKGTNTKSRPSTTKCDGGGSKHRLTTVLEAATSCLASAASMRRLFHGCTSVVFVESSHIFNNMRCDQHFRFFNQSKNWHDTWYCATTTTKNNTDAPSRAYLAIITSIEHNIRGGHLVLGVTRGRRHRRPHDGRRVVATNVGRFDQCQRDAALYGTEKHDKFGERRPNMSHGTPVPGE